MDDIFKIFDDLLSDDEDVINVIEMPRRPKVFRARRNHLEMWDDMEFMDRFRLSKATVLLVLDTIIPQIAFPTDRNGAVDPLHQLLLTLRFYASGSFLITVGDFGGIHKATASRIIPKVTRAIASLAPQHICLPRTNGEIAKTKQQFYEIARFPKVIGAIDCTHIKIQSPGNNVVFNSENVDIIVYVYFCRGPTAENFRNRKGFFSLNVQTVADAQLRICNIVARWPGAAHDSTIFNNSRLRANLKANYEDCFILGDSGYGLKTYLMTPLQNPQSHAEQLYNEAQIRTRNVVERSYGVWKRRFPILSIGMRLKMETIQSVIVATAVLHNIAINNSDVIPDDEHHMLNDNVEIQEANNINIDGNAQIIRTILINNYFGNLE